MTSDPHPAMALWVTSKFDRSLGRLDLIKIETTYIARKVQSNIYIYCARKVRNIFYDLVSSSHSHFVLADALGPVFTLALSRRRHFCLKSLRGFWPCFFVLCSVRTQPDMCQVRARAIPLL